eukprot:s1905_g1.t1
MLRRTPATPALASNAPSRLEEPSAEGKLEQSSTKSGFSGSEESFQAEERDASKKRSTTGGRGYPGLGGPIDHLKSRLLRIMRNNYETGTATLEDDDDESEASLGVRPPPRLNVEELQRLDDLLPALPGKDPWVDPW